MTEEYAIKAENLGKRFQRKVYSRGQALRYNMEAIFKAPIRNAASFLKSESNDIEQLAVDNHFWALQKVSFTIRPGEVVGIVGHNGAGKSILLKILSRITKPTTGYADIYGKCSSMLEVDTGFHQELTGAENIYMSGAILGMKKKYIQEKFEEIIALSELEAFLETPVKRFSSGMRVRLAFAIAAQLKPDILILDEILAVGDQAFRKKCMRFLQDLTAQGTTVLLVSHNEKNILDICSRAFLFEKGQLILDDKPDVVLKNYAQNSK